MAPSETTATGNKSAPGLVAEAGKTVPSEAVLTLTQTSHLASVLSSYNLEVVTTLTIPATSSFPKRTYYLVREKDGEPVSFSGFTADTRIASAVVHNTVWIPEDDRDDLTFDDEDTWRSGGQYQAQYAFSKLNIHEAHGITEGQGEVIAILDTGFDTSHPLFISGQANVVLGSSYLYFPPGPGVGEWTGNGLNEDGEGATDDAFGHGTHVAGIIFTAAPKATLKIQRVLNDEGRGYVMGVAKAIVAMVGQVNIIHMSLGLQTDVEVMHHAIQYASQAGIVIVASAGNQGMEERDAPHYPAAYDEVIAVASVDRFDQKVPSSGYGTWVDIAAPGVDIISSIPQAKYATAGGTSMAAPWVTGAVALAHANWRTQMSAQAAAEQVIASSVRIDEINPLYPGQLGRGRVDLRSPLSFVIWE